MAAGRRMWVGVHRWIALTIGLVLALLGMTGSVMVLHEPILRWEVGAVPLTLQSPPAPDTPMASADTWKSAAALSYPQFSKVLGTVPPGTGFLTSQNAMAFGMLKGRKGTGIAMLDPYTAAPRGFFVFDDLLLSKVVAFHRFLMLPPPIGSLLIAVCGLCLAISLATGLWLWWPRGLSWERWKKSATMSWRSKGMKRWLELHNVSAVYLFIPLAVLAVTGILLAQPRWFAWLGLPQGPGSPVSSLHARLMLGRVGEAIIFLTGIALPVLYVSGLAMWWKKRKAKGRGT